MLKSFVVALALLAAATVAGAQTVTNPTVAIFPPSADHDKNGDDGQPLVTSYALEYWLEGASAPFQTNNLGKPAASADGLIHFDISSQTGDLLIGHPIGQIYFATVSAVGPGGTGRSPNSNPFNFSSAPSAPAAPASLVLQSPSTPPPLPLEIVLYAADFAAADIHGDFRAENDASAAAGISLNNPNRNAPKSAVLANPDTYVEARFYARSGVAYHVWMRSRAENDNYNNDSLTFQFSGSLNAVGAAAWRIGTQSGMAMILEEGSGAGELSWGWNDNSYSLVPGSHIYFAEDGQQTIRIQQREDGIRFDQIVISSATYLNTRPGTTKSDTTIVPKP